MAEIEDDYDDESCLSNDEEDQKIQRLDQTVPGAGGSVPLSTPIHINKHEPPLAVIRQEDTGSEVSGSTNKTNKQFLTTTDHSPQLSTTDHSPRALPSFPDTSTCMWTSSHAANCPSEDRSCSLVNVLMRPNKNDHNRALIRLSLWSVIDGHGGGCVATYASEVLLPLLAASVSRSLDCLIVDRGVCTVNGELRDANALDLDGLIRTSDRSRVNPNSIHYRSPCETDDAGEGDNENAIPLGISETDTLAHQDEDPPSIAAEASVASPILPRATDAAHSVSSAKTSVKTSASNSHTDAPVGTHSPSEVAKITKAITESFLAVDEGWINSIDPVATHQSSCQSNGRWNAGACALVVFTVQRLEWTSASIENRRFGTKGLDMRDDASENRDAARRRMLDYAAKVKSASSVSTISSSSSMLTATDPNGSLSFESEVTETEDDDASHVAEKSARKTFDPVPPPSIKQTVILTPDGCQCHVYKSHEAMLYTAHVGDCRAVLLGSAPPRTIKVGPVGDSSTDHPDTTDDESSYHSSDETECLSSSDHDAESSDEEDADFKTGRVSITAPPHLKYMRRPARRPRCRSRRDMGNHAPFVALPPLRPDGLSSEESESETECSSAVIRTKFQQAGRGADGNNSDGSSKQSSEFSYGSSDSSPPLVLAAHVRPIDLTKDHSAYNPTEVSAVLRRCNNAPRAISAGVGGGIKRVAGSLAVTRALGDAYLKTPRLSFAPFARHAPYITAQPEVSCRMLTKNGDRVLVLATDGVWERCTGEDVLRWIRNYTAERIADAGRRSNRRWGTERLSQDSVDNDDPQDSPNPNDDDAGASVGQKRDRNSPVSTSNNKKRKVMPRGSHRHSFPGKATAADVIVRRVLNKVRRARNMSSIDALMALPKGRARRSKHDDITASVIDLSKFVS